MVRRILFFFLTFTAAFALIDVAAQISADQELIAGRSFYGQLMVTHEKSDPILLGGITMGGKPLYVEKERVVDIGNGVVMTIFRFPIEGKQAGTHTLAPIEVLVAGKRHETVAINYEVRPKVSAPQGKQGMLDLQAQVEGTSTLYPGQETYLTYLFLFHGSIELSKEELPLLKPEGVKKIGKPVVETGREGEISIHKISQKIQAISPGTFSFGPSVIEGYAYGRRADGQKELYETPLSATAAPVTLTVLPFPEKGKPFSFLKAVGSYDLFARIAGDANIVQGQPIELEVIISGTGPLDTVQPPKLCCQPGFPGWLPGSSSGPGVQSGNQKIFRYRLTPLSEDLKAVPPIEFSYFNPELASYVVKRSKPIPIHVSPKKKEKKRELRKTASWREFIVLKKSIPNITPYVPNMFPYWIAALILSLGTLALRYALYYIPSSDPDISCQYLKRAFIPSYSAGERVRLLRRAFELKAQAIGKQLPDEVHAFFDDVEQRLYGPSGEEEIKTKDLRRAKWLFGQLS